LFTGCKGFYVDQLDQTACPSVVSGGETEAVSPAKSAITVADSQIEEVWGGYMKENQPNAIEGTAALTVSGDKTKIGKAGL
ncbi:hypothetical protein LH384_34595, partial [Pseudomonas aeruginosa]|nr:hypothetical protein [Pseudomonas aeruginosa]